MHSRSIQSDYLFAQPTFISGLARLLDLSGTYDRYNISPTDREADYKALLSDWYAVGQDIADSMSIFAANVPAPAAEPDLCAASKR